MKYIKNECTHDYDCTVLTQLEGTQNESIKDNGTC